MDETTSKHTPGPWMFYVDGPSIDPNWHIVTSANRLRHIANIHIEPGNKMDLANAHLIAAAPDLYAAAQALLAIDSKPVMEEIKLLPKRMQNQVVKDHNAKVKAVLESLKAAIAKAEGRS